MIKLTQNEANTLIEIEKHRESENSIEFPIKGEKKIIPLTCLNKKEKFLLDINNSGKVVTLKYTHQTRAKEIIPLVRIDIGKTLVHINPDGKKIEGHHIHIYKEKFDDRYASPLPENFYSPNDIFKTIQEFMKYCNITKVPLIEKGLFT